MVIAAAIFLAGFGIMGLIAIIGGAFLDEVAPISDEADVSGEALVPAVAPSTLTSLANH
jgi:hypothetical protein